MEDIDHLADDTVYLSMNQVTNAGGPGSKPNQSDINNCNNDDEIIDYFLDNNPDWVVCEFYKQGNCRYGDNCKYMHPKSLTADT